MIVDTHAHLMFSEFDEDREETLVRAFAAGVKKIINIGCGEESSAQAVAMMKEFEGRDDLPRLYATVGLHPYDAGDLREDLIDEWRTWIVEDLKSGKRGIVGIGETGLDYFKSKVDPEIQKKSFRRHMKFADEMNLPVVVHNRDADEDCLEILKEFPGVQAVFHCYGSSLDFAKRVWEAGYYTSFTGIVTFKNADALREVVAAVPMDRLMVETDCPYLAPQEYRGKRNEPAYVAEVVKMIAEVKNLTNDEIAEISTKNAGKLFGI
jgi:TatD DNase family protein